MSIQRKKKILVFLFLITVFCFKSSDLLYAQDNSQAAMKHSWHVGGVFSGYHHFGNSEKENELDESQIIKFNPRVLWYVINGLGIGMDADLYHFNSYFDHTNISFGPRVAYYYMAHEKIQYLIPNIGLSLHYVYNDADFGINETGWRFKFGLGISPLLGDHLTIPIELGLMSERLTQDYYEDESLMVTNNRLFLEVGFGAFLWKED